MTRKSMSTQAHQGGNRPAANMSPYHAFNKKSVGMTMQCMVHSTALVMPTLSEIAEDLLWLIIKKIDATMLQM